MLCRAILSCWFSGKGKLLADREKRGEMFCLLSSVTFPLLLSSLTSAKPRALLQRYRTSENRPGRRKLRAYLQLHSPQGLQSWVCSPFKETQSVMIIENVWPNARSFYLLFLVWARPISTEPFLACACVSYQVFVGRLVINLWRRPNVKKKSNFFSDLLTCLSIMLLCYSSGSWPPVALHINSPSWKFLQFRGVSLDFPVPWGPPSSFWCTVLHKVKISQCIWLNSPPFKEVFGCP